MDEVVFVLALIGKKQVTQVKGKPERAIDQAQQTVNTLKAAPAALRGQPTPAALPTTPAATALETTPRV